MVKREKEAILQKAEELGWLCVTNNISTEPIELHHISSGDWALPHPSITIAGKDPVAEVDAILGEYSTDDIVLEWAKRESGSGCGLQQLLDKAQSLRAELRILRDGMKAAQEDYKMYISGVALSNMLSEYMSATGLQFQELYQGVNAAYTVRRKKTGTGHATRWWYHREDVEAFCKSIIELQATSSKADLLPHRKLTGLYLLVGPSGSGKTSISGTLMASCGYTSVVSYTDRPKRSEDEQGHIFITEEQFNQLKDVVGYTKFDNHQYGTTYDVINAHDLYVVDLPGVTELREVCKRNNRPCHVIGIHCPPEIRYQRMVNRGDDLTMVCQRIAHDKDSFAAMNELCDIIVPNRNFDTTLDIIAYFIKSCEARDGKMKCNNADKPEHRVVNFKCGNDGMAMVKGDVKISLENKGSLTSQENEDMLSMMVYERDGMNWCQAYDAFAPTNIPAAAGDDVKCQALNIYMSELYETMASSSQKASRGTEPVLSKQAAEAIMKLCSGAASNEGGDS